MKKQYFIILILCITGLIHTSCQAGELIKKYIVAPLSNYTSKCADPFTYVLAAKSKKVVQKINIYTLEKNNIIETRLVSFTTEDQEIFKNNYDRCSFFLSAFNSLYNINKIEEINRDELIKAVEIVNDLELSEFVTPSCRKIILALDATLKKSDENRVYTNKFPSSKSDPGLNGSTSEKDKLTNSNGKDKQKTPSDSPEKNPVEKQEPNNAPAQEVKKD